MVSSSVSPGRTMINKQYWPVFPVNNRVHLCSQRLTGLTRVQQSPRGLLFVFWRGGDGMVGVVLELGILWTRVFRLGIHRVTIVMISRWTRPKKNHIKKNPKINDKWVYPSTHTCQTPNYLLKFHKWTIFCKIFHLHLI